MKGSPPLSRSTRCPSLREIGEQPVDLLLAHGVMVALLADIDASGVAAGHVEDGLGDQPVVDHHVRLLHEAQGAEGQEVRVAGAGADQIDLAHVAIQGVRAPVRAR